MEKFDFLGSIVLLIFGLVICFESLHLGLGTWMVPGAGFLPFSAGLSLALLSLAISVLAIVRKKEIPYAAVKYSERPNSGKIVSIVFVSLIVYNILWTILGFSLTTFLFLGFLFWVGKRNWSFTIIGAAIISLLTYILFQLFLDAQLPTGIIGF